MRTINDLTLDKLVTKFSRNFFSFLNLSTTFLESDPITWENRPDYNSNLKIVKSLQVINDRGERCVKLISEYNLALTRDDDIKQSICRIVKKFREHYPNFKKETLNTNLLDYYIFNKKVPGE